MGQGGCLVIPSCYIKVDLLEVPCTCMCMCMTYKESRNSVLPKGVEDAERVEKRRAG